MDCTGEGVMFPPALVCVPLFSSDAPVDYIPMSGLALTLSRRALSDTKLRQFLLSK